MSEVSCDLEDKRSPYVVRGLDKRALTRRARRFLRHMIHHVAVELGEGDLKRSAIVFSPHFDDETLGCGGTILKKRELGADVKIVFMTDGTSSHNDLIAAQELAEMRRREGHAAARVLGLYTEDVHLLDFRDSKLADHAETARRRVQEILREEQPQDVFVPYHRDQLADHVATHGIVNVALRGYGEEVTVYEYPIWFWRHWPWTNIRHLRHRSLQRAIKDGVKSGVRLLRECRWCVHVADVEETKRAALAEHRSQMTRLSSDPRWPVLGDVWDGDFLECFFQEYELFMKRVVPPRRAKPS